MDAQTPAAFVPSTVEQGATVTVMAVVTGDCALVRGVLAGWELREHASTARDARVAQIVAYYKSR